MSIWKNGKLVAGGSQALPLLTFMWADHILDNISWLRADTFSWQSGSVYQAVYQHLADDFTNGTRTLVPEGAGIWCYIAPDGHRIVDASDTTQVQNVIDLYNTTGVAWYYIIDTTNQRFKLPRTKFGVTGLRDTVGNYVPESLPNLTGTVDWNNGDQGHTELGTATGVFNKIANTSKTYPSKGATTSAARGFTFDASRSSAAYQDDAPVQQRATQMYLYFYVGQFTQTALENTAGINTELFNEKLDQDFSNATTDIASSLNNVGARTIVETYASGNDWYRKYSDGWVEQGSNAHNRGSSNTWNFLVPMAGTYNAQITARGSQRYAWVTDMQTGYLKFSAADDSSQNNDGLYYIKVCGYAAS